MSEKENRPKSLIYLCHTPDTHDLKYKIKIRDFRYRRGCTELDKFITSPSNTGKKADLSG